MNRSYESEFTLFLRELKQKNPEIEREQHIGRAIFWDKNIDQDLYRRYKTSDVPQPAYVYGSKVNPTKASS